MARSELQTCLIAAGLLMVLAGCAPTVPSSLAVPEQPCDVICHVLRLLDFDPAPPAPAPSIGAAEQHPPVRPKVRHGQKTKPGRRAHLTVVTSAAPSSAPVGPPAKLPDVPPAADRGSPGEPAIASAAPSLSGDDRPLVPIPGSPAITPPWFEPMSPLNLRAGREGDPVPAP